MDPQAALLLDQGLVRKSEVRPDDLAGVYELQPVFSAEVEDPKYF